MLARDTDIADVPFAWDIEFAVFERYRIPGRVFPLRIVLDREGNVVLKNFDEELDAVEAAIQEVL